MFLSAWVAHFGCPSDITSNRDPQFVSELWSAMANGEVPGHARSCTNENHPQAKNVQTFSSFQGSVSGCLWVMLGLHSALKKDLDTSPAELVFGQLLHIPEEFLKESVAPLSLHFQLTQPPPCITVFPWSFVPTALATTRFVFVRHVAHQSSLQGLYEGTLRVLEAVLHVRHGWSSGKFGGWRSCEPGPASGEDP